MRPAKGSGESALLANTINTEISCTGPYYIAVIYMAHIFKHFGCQDGLKYIYMKNKVSTNSEVGVIYYVMCCCLNVVMLCYCFCCRYFCLILFSYLFRLFFIIFIVFHYPENKFSNVEFLWSIYGFPEYLDLSIKTNLLI